MPSRRWRHGPGAASRRREPRQSGQHGFHPVFGQLAQPWCAGHDETDASLAGAIAAGAGHSAARSRDLDELPAFIAATEAQLRDGASPADPQQVGRLAYACKNCREGDWYKASMFAVVAGMHRTVCAFLREGAATGKLTRRDIDRVEHLQPDNGTNQSPLTLLRLAVKFRKHAVAAVLLQAGADPNVAPPAALSNLTLAVSNRDDAPMVKLLLDYGARMKAELVLAAQLRAVESLRELLQAPGAEVNAAKAGNTPLVAAMPAVGEGGDAARKTLQCTELLLAAGASPNIGPKTTPIVGAAAFGHVGIVELLLKHGAKLGTVHAGYTVDALSASLRARHAGVVRVLLDHGAPLDLPFALARAAEQPSGEVAEVVLEHAAAVFRDASARHRASLLSPREVGDFLESVADGGWSPATFRRVLAPHREWFPVDALSDQGTTALQRAVTRGQIPLVRALLDIGADPAAKARDGRTTALSIAQRKVHAAAEGSVERRMAEGVLRLLQPS